MELELLDDNETVVRFWLASSFDDGETSVLG
jgi:hypothetical protein